MIEDGLEIVDMREDLARCPGPAEAAAVIGDDLTIGGEPFHLGPPHAEIREPGMKENDSRPAAGDFPGQACAGDVDSEGLRHGRAFYRPSARISSVSSIVL